MKKILYLNHPEKLTGVPLAMYEHILSSSFDRAFTVSSALALLENPRAYSGILMDSLALPNGTHYMRPVDQGECGTGLYVVRRAVKDRLPVIVRAECILPINVSEVLSALGVHVLSRGDYSDGRFLEEARKLFIKAMRRDFIDSSS